MMECKKALTEAEGDLARAEEILRVKLGNKASKAAARVTAEGLIGLFISADAKKGAVIEVNCETDFVAKNDDFVAFVNKLAELVATQNPADVAALSALPYGDGTVETTRTALIGKIGETSSPRTTTSSPSEIQAGRTGRHANPTDALSALPYGDGTVETTALIGKIGEYGDPPLRAHRDPQRPGQLRARRPHRRAGRVQRLGRSRQDLAMHIAAPSPRL